MMGGILSSGGGLPKAGSRRSMKVVSRAGSRRSLPVVPAKLCRASMFARPLRGPRGAAMRRPPWIPRAPEAPPLDSVRGAGLYRKISLACLRQTIEGSHGGASGAKTEGVRPHERFLTHLPVGRGLSRGKRVSTLPECSEVGKIPQHKIAVLKSNPHHGNTGAGVTIPTVVVSMGDS